MNCRPRAYETPALPLSYPAKGREPKGSTRFRQEGRRGSRTGLVLPLRVPWLTFELDIGQPRELRAESELAVAPWTPTWGAGERLDPEPEL